MHPSVVIDGASVVRAQRRWVDPSIENGSHSRAVVSDAAHVIRGPCIIQAGGRAVAVCARWPESTAALTESVRAIPCKRVRRDGQLVVATRVWGRYPTPRSSKLTTLSADHPDADAALRGYAATLGALFAATMPEVHAAAVARVRIPLAEGAPWTTGSINSATATAYHRDTRNLPNTWSGMLVLRGAGVDGGELVLPELGIAIDLRDGDVLFFDGGDLWHGNRALTVPEGSHRFSLPCYAMEM